MYCPIAELPDVGSMNKYALAVSGLGVGVDVTVGVIVGVIVAVTLGVGVIVSVILAVNVIVGVIDGVIEIVGVIDGVIEIVGVIDGVIDGVFVIVGVGVGVRELGVSVGLIVGVTDGKGHVNVFVNIQFELSIIFTKTWGDEENTNGTLNVTGKVDVEAVITKTQLSCCISQTKILYGELPFILLIVTLFILTN